MTERLFGVQRHERLLSELRRSGSVRVTDLARELGVSELTIRRDIAALAERNLVTRVHGGATLPSQGAPVDGARRTHKRHFTIGIVVPSLDFYWPPIVAGARAAAAALGVALQLRGSSYDPDEDRRQIGRLVEANQVQGLLLAPSLDGEMIDWIGRLPVPTILIERQPHRWTATPRQLEWVRSDHALGAEIAVHHLHQQGHRRIGLVLSRGSPTSDHLLQGWRSACVELSISDAMVVRESVALTAREHRRIIREVLAECRRAQITALIVHSDPDAVSVAQFCAEHGVAIPDDLAVVSYDDEVAHLAEPALTAVRPPKHHVGRLAVELMVSRLIDGDRRPSQRVLVAPELVVRHSSLSLVRKPGMFDAVRS
ncbi:LacI family DNA-binding transcriptional regulator [Dactylosporangium matsuzakiense]|uniref:LacI family transcriptional regulator n=1 Tax=Dactylosporangium matsuzakiense TaxID=53360 RepID=A0A9W6KVD0_9ACTN|nr:substrate-binding domain-containing protein [Dactylosporangium matsuzakiense]UWZ42588.1 DeoR/GlpR family transcriptional regulator [Dactylosporangium matsuzakiense]GLL06144.1 LacI family transcriptional regulator [Dactylosporangium matsuzakiense]